MMPSYEYECDGCGDRKSVTMSVAEYDEMKRNGMALAVDEKHATGQCGHYSRVFERINIMRDMPEHYSHQLESVVSGTRDFKKKLRQQEIDNSQRLGYDVHYETIDPTDPVAAGVTDEGMDATNRRDHNTAADGHKSTFS